MKRTSILCLLLCFASVSLASTHDRDSMLLELDYAVAHAQDYRLNVEQRIAKTRGELRHAMSMEDKVRLTQSMCYLYFMYKNDSAFAYNTILRQLATDNHDNALYVRVVCERAMLYAQAGLPYFGFFLLDSLRMNPAVNTPDMKKMVYSTYFDINDFVYHLNLPTSILTNNVKMIASIRDSFYYYCPDQKEQAVHTEAQLMSSKEVIEKMERQMASAQSDQQRAVYAMIIYNRLKTDAIQEDRDYYLILSAIYNIRAASMDNAALIKMVQKMIDEEDWDRATNYLKLAQDQSLFYGSRSRALQLAPMVQQVGDHLIEQAQGRKKYNHIYLVIIVLLVAVGSTVIYLLSRRMRRMQAKVKTLTDSSVSADEREAKSRSQMEAQSDALSQFMGIATDATYEYVHLRHMVMRRLKNNDASGLLKQMKEEGNTGKVETAMLRKFDVAFLHLFPNFIIKINHLLQPDCQISKPENELLSTELRIIALWRLGIKDAGRVATILNLSVNTIYFYRNKLRNGAKDREHFDEQLMEIKSV